MGRQKNRIKNEIKKGVPFIIKSGKALNERKGEIRIQFKEAETNIFENYAQHGKNIPRNEFVIRLQPNEVNKK